MVYRVNLINSIVYLNSKKIGAVIGDVFQTKRNPSKHFYRNLAAYCINHDVINMQNIRSISIVIGNRLDGKILSISIGKLVEFNRVFNMYYKNPKDEKDLQIVIPEVIFDITRYVDTKEVREIGTGIQEFVDNVRSGVGSVSTNWLKRMKKDAVKMSGFKEMKLDETVYFKLTDVGKKLLDIKQKKLSSVLFNRNDSNTIFSIDNSGFYFGSFEQFNIIFSGVMSEKYIEGGVIYVK